MGMTCPFCGSENNKVVDSREINSGIKRRRECLNCRMRWNTYEYSEYEEQKTINLRIEAEKAKVDAQLTIQHAITTLQQIKI